MQPMEELALMGKLNEEVVVLGKKFKFRTLDSDEHISAKAAASIWPADSKEHAAKVEILVRALDSVEGVPFSALLKKDEAEKEGAVLMKARESISKWQRAVTDRVYAAYLTLERKQNDVLEELEKNGSSPHTSTTAGK